MRRHASGMGAAPPERSSQDRTRGGGGVPRDTTIPASAWLTDEAKASAKSGARRRKDAAMGRREAQRASHKARFRRSSKEPGGNQDVAPRGAPSPRIVPRVGNAGKARTTFAARTRGCALNPPHPEERTKCASRRMGRPRSFETHCHSASKTRVGALSAMLLRMRPAESMPPLTPRASTQAAAKSAFRRGPRSPP